MEQNHSPDQLEIEAKFIVVDSSQIERLRSLPMLPDGLRPGEESTVDVTDSYIDTADRRMLRCGYSLRLRQSGERMVVTAKSLTPAMQGTVQRRLEVEGDVAAESANASILDWPQDLQQLVNETAGPEPKFSPLCTLRQTRFRRDIFAPMEEKDAAESVKATPIAEFTLDRVHIFEQAEDAGALVTVWEIEIELKAGGDEEQVLTIADRLAGDEALRPAAGSKFVQALRLSAAVGKFLPADHVAEACRAIWRQQFTEVLLHEAALHADSDPEALDEIWIAFRKICSAKNLFAGYFRRRQIKDMVAILEQNEALIDEAHLRETVLRELTQYGATLPETERHKLAPLTLLWSERRLAALSDVSDWWHSATYGRFVADFSAFCSSPGRGAKGQKMRANRPPGSTQLRHVLPGMAMDRFLAVRRFEITFEADAPASMSTLQALCVDCARLDLLLGFMVASMGGAAPPLLRDLERLALSLDGLNRSYTARQLLTDIAPASWNTAIEGYASSLESAVAAHRSEIPDLFRQFVREENRRQLGAMISRP